MKDKTIDYCFHKISFDLNARAEEFTFPFELINTSVSVSSISWTKQIQQSVE